MPETCVVTGGAGFIGAHLCRELVAAGWRVRALDALDPQVHEGAEAAALPPEVELVEADVRDPQAVARAIEGADAVAHLAAKVGVGQSMYEIDRYVGVNDLGTAVLLQALIAHPVRRIVVASSMSVYGEGRYVDAAGAPVAVGRRAMADLAEGRWEPRSPSGPLSPAPTDEEKPVDLASIYALTKYVQERAVLLFGEAYRTEAVALRLFNVFGAGQALSNPYTGVLANFASRLAAGERPMIFEDGRQRRDFVHVEDVARAFRLALETPKAAGEVINVGSGRSYAIADVARLLAREMGREVEPEILGKARAGDIRNCFADIAKAEALLGFAPERPLEDSLGPFVDWVAGARFRDNGATMRRELETRGLVA